MNGEEEGRGGEQSKFTQFPATQMDTMAAEAVIQGTNCRRAPPSPGSPHNDDLFPKREAPAPP